MKKGKIATLAGFCALFAALCFTACGDEGKENATPLPTNTAVQTETAKPTEVPTVEPTAVPTTKPTEVPEIPMPTIETLSDDYNAKDLDYEVLKKMYLTIFPEREDYNYSMFGDWRYSSEFYEDCPEHTLCSFIDVGDSILLVAYIRHPPFMVNSFHLAFFTYEGELINIVFSNKQFRYYKNIDYRIFKLDHNYYFAVSNYDKKEKLDYRWSLMKIYELKEDTMVLAWDESDYFPGATSKGDPIETCGNAYGWVLEQNGVTVYVHKDAVPHGHDSIKHFTFDELLSGVDITDW